ncbi:WYL domain-containing protein [Vibrio metschnikovii]|uniref:WYL domain-containing protein n=1 Tax=Vibrio metschnikovii TaxID=28172 RepID=UPI001C2F6BB5|nr:WYL domain-containing protein [Vibrio metschnikovii]MDA3139705.1 WYL domain-containing protein [Vibrio metschnikovii]
MAIQSMFDLQQEENNADRMAYIDFKLRFTGSINRLDLTHMFGLKEAAASKMMKAYSEMRPGNMDYDRRERANTILRETFHPLLDIDAEIALGMLANGFNKNKLLNTPEISYYRLGRIRNQLNIRNVERITRAISGEYSITCAYISKSSKDHNKRELLPLNVIFDGKTWIFRAFDIKDKKFKNFNFARAKDVEENIHRKIKPNEKLSEDKAWITEIPLLLVPHPKLNSHQKQALINDFAMKDEKLIISEKAALIWILNRIWNVDTRKKSQIDSDKRSENTFNFWLSNKDMVEAVIDNLELNYELNI